MEKLLRQNLMIRSGLIKYLTQMKAPGMLGNLRLASIHIFLIRCRIFYLMKKLPEASTLHQANAMMMHSMEIIPIFIGIWSIFNARSTAAEKSILMMYSSVKTDCSSYLNYKG